MYFQATIDQWKHMIIATSTASSKPQTCQRSLRNELGAVVSISKQGESKNSIAG